MSMHRYYSLAKMLKTAKEKGKQCHTISFDLFDTLLIRRVHDPDLVKLPVARFIAAKAEVHGSNWSWEKVQRLRDRVEKRQRQETGKTFDDFEACYPQFMRETLQEIFGAQEVETLLREVTDYEVAMENSMLVPRAQLVSWLEELAAQGKQILVISDVYLPADFLERLIEHAGFLESVTKVISSADSFLAKASGKAYSLVQKKYGLEKEGWLHIGDNPISDGLRAEEFGIQALVLLDGSEKRRKAVVRRHIGYSAGRPFWRGRALQQLMQPLEKENIPRPPLYVEGYTFLAPLIGVFVQHIAQRCRELGISKVFFLSREGWTFKKFWEKAMPFLYPDETLPEVEYLYVSRMALAGAGCAHKGLTRTNADIAFLPSGNRDFLDVCRIFSLDADGFISHLDRHKLKTDTVLSPLHEEYKQENRLRFNELLEDDEFQAEVKRQVRPANEALHRYLDELDFFKHDDIALVDIGWLGTIQRFFFDAVGYQEDCPRCHGFLFGATRGISYPTTPDNYIEGVIYDRNRFDLAASSILYSQDLFEEACRAPHPTLNGYRLTETGYELEFRRTDDATGLAEKEQDEYYSSLQQGILDAAERFGAASSLLGYSLVDYKPWLNYLLTGKLAFPKTREIMTIRHKHHLDDFHGQNKPLPGYSKALKHLWSSSEGSLRFSPLLRFRYFVRHIKDRLNE